MSEPRVCSPPPGAANVGFALFMSSPGIAHASMELLSLLRKFGMPASRSEAYTYSLRIKERGFPLKLTSIMDKKILIVDDERDICEILEFNLASEGFEVVSAHSAEEAFEMLSADVSLILLDVMMGGMSGYKMAEKLRREGNRTPIIFLTAKDTENDMLTGFSVGGDDYISKPFSIKEVVARTKAVLRRLDAPAENDGRKFEFGDVVIDLETKELTVGKERIVLTKTEFEILSLLAGHPDRLFSREEIIEKVWAETPFITERTVDVHITRLRKKMGSRGALIENRSGYGYRFNSENS